jgi:hypothetical protein
MPAPEFCALGTVTSDLFDCAKAIPVDIASANATALTANFIVSTSMEPPQVGERPSQRRVPDFDGI